MTLLVDPMVDSERLVANYLQGVTEVTTLVSSRVFTTLPPSPVYPAVVLHRAGGIPVLRQRLDNARIQIDAWGRTKSEAQNLAATTRAALHSMAGAHPTGVVTGIDDAVGLVWLPDPDSNQPRYLFAVNVFLHP